MGKGSLTQIGIIAVATVLLLVGCSSVPTKMVGEFNGHRGDAILVRKDGSLLWSSDPKQSNSWRFVGIAAADKQDPTRILLTVPSASPFPYPKAEVALDLSQITLDWGAVRQGRSTEYKKIEPPD